MYVHTVAVKEVCTCIVPVHTMCTQLLLRRFVHVYVYTCTYYVHTVAVKQIVPWAGSPVV